MCSLFQLLMRFLLLVNGVHRVEMSMFSNDDICSQHWQCASNKVCCKNDIFSVFRCRRRLDTIRSTRSCFGYYCTSNSDCKGLKDGQKLCCMSNTCTLCSEECVTHSDCGQSQFCCKGAWWERSECRYTCINKYCADYSNCGIGECCKYSRCAQCSERGCTHDSQCRPSQKCCDQDFYPDSECRYQCSGGSCNSDEDCAISAYCDSHICMKSDNCTSQTDCSDGRVCCGLINSPKHVGYCRQNCIGNLCQDDKHCGQVDECCSFNSKCQKCGTTCQSSSDCFNSAVCCKDPFFGENKCASKCDKEACIQNSDCVTAHKWCSDGICSDATKQCDHNLDCITSYGEQLHCCFEELSGLKFCSLTCDRRICTSDHNCTGMSECCNSDGFCVTAGCPFQVPRWLLGLFIAAVTLVTIIVIWCYRLKRKRRLNRDGSGSNTISPGNDNEGPDNISEEMQHLPSTNLESTVGNDRIESSVLPPSYTQSNTGIPNIPPPPYSVDDHIVSPELNNEPPPRYRVIQM